ncbi:MAG TPA: LamG-like jellyroll fold domain-containing protein [Stellaceae bacterium]
MPRIAPWKTTAKGLVACWPFFEGAGPALHDVSGQGNDGTNPGTWYGTLATGSVVPPFSTISLNGSEYIAAVAGNSPVRTGKVSACAWVAPASLTRGDLVTVWYSGGNGNDQFDLLFASGVPYFFVSNGTTTADAAGAGISANVWQHLCGTFDGATVKIYVNGLLY